MNRAVLVALVLAGALLAGGCATERYSGSYFRLGPQDVIDLKNAGVSDRVIGAMVKMNEPPRDAEGSYEYRYYPYWYAAPFRYPSFHIHRMYGPHFGYYGHRVSYGRHIFPAGIAPLDLGQEVGIGNHRGPVACVS